MVNPRIGLLLLLLLFWTVEPLYGWGAKTHRRLTQMALELCSVQSRKSLRGFEGVLEAGVVAPDGRGKGAIGAYNHCFDPQRFADGDGRCGGGPKTVARLSKGALRARSDDEAFVFELGRVLHILQDLAQPFHTGSGCQEKRYHSRYERWVDEELELLFGTLKPRCVMRRRPKWPIRRWSDTVEEQAFAIAVQSKAQWQTLHLACRRRPWGSALEETTVQSLLRGLEVSVLCIDELSYRRCRLTASFAGVDVFVLALFMVSIHLIGRLGAGAKSNSRTGSRKMGSSKR